MLLGLWSSGLANGRLRCVIYTCSKKLNAFVQDLQTNICNSRIPSYRGIHVLVFLLRCGRESAMLNIRLCLNVALQNSNCHDARHCMSNHVCDLHQGANLPDEKYAKYTLTHGSV